MKFQYKPGSRYSVPAEVVGKELETIKGEGRLTPGAVVDAARPEDSPLHKLFEWDDAKAAEAHRLSQARGLIRCVQVVVESSEPTPLFVHVPGVESGYESVSVLVKRPDEFARALGELKVAMRSLMNSVSQLERVAVENGIQEEALEDIGTIKSHLTEAQTVAGKLAA